MTNAQAQVRKTYRVVYRDTTYEVAGQHYRARYGEPAYFDATAIYIGGEPHDIDVMPEMSDFTISDIERMVCDYYFDGELT